MATRANSVLGVLVTFLLLFFATVTDLMKKADVFSKTGRIGDNEKRALELWMTSQQTPVMNVTKEEVFKHAKAFAADELGWKGELDFSSARMITTVAEGLSSVELTTVTTATSRKKLYTIRQRSADNKRLAEQHKVTIDKDKLKRLNVQAAAGKAAAKTAKTAKTAGGGGAEDEEHERTDTDGGAWAAQVKEFNDEYLYKIAAVLSQQPNIPLETLSLLVGIIGDAVIGQAKVLGYNNLSELTPEVNQLATYWQVPYMCCLFYIDAP